MLPFANINPVHCFVLIKTLFTILLQSKTLGKDVFEKTCDYLILRERQYFGLTYTDAEGIRVSRDIRFDPLFHISNQDS